MRRALAALLLLSALLPVAGAQAAPQAPAAPPCPDLAGGETFPHVNPCTLTLAPGQERRIPLGFEEDMTVSPTGGAAFASGWVFVLNAVVPPGSAPVRAQLLPGPPNATRTAVADWTLQPQAATQHVTSDMPEADVYTLSFGNPGSSGNATVTFFYDQSCNCAGKPIPPEVPDGLVVFNVDVKKGSTWSAVIPEPKVHELNISLATRTSERSVWPQDFRVVEESDTAQTVDVGAGPIRLHNLTWTADQDGRYYFFVESKAQDLGKFDTSSSDAMVASVMVTPHYDQLAAASTASKTTPLGAVALPALAVAAALLALRRG